ncbi:hypothetical protein [Labilithrix luteola]|nr:hypothetical protein [Labilithrix luteola]
MAIAALLTILSLFAAFAAGFELARRGLPTARQRAFVAALASQIRRSGPRIAVRTVYRLARLRRRAPRAEARPLATELPPPIHPIDVPSDDVVESTPAPTPAIMEPPPASTDRESIVRYEEFAPRGTKSTEFHEHAEPWRAAMASLGERLHEERVVAVVFAHGTFVGTDPLSAFTAIERALPSRRPFVKALRRRTREYADRVFGDFGNFGVPYVRLFEKAIGARIPCTSFVWSSENHHLGRLDGALALVRVLATHAELGEPGGRILVLGHSHAGQVFALVTQLLSRSLAAEAILDVARARSLDVNALDVDLEALERTSLDFVTFGSPVRYAWAESAKIRSLHVAGDDWVRRIGSAASDFPALAPSDRRINAALDPALGTGFAPGELLRSLRGSPMRPTHGELVIVDYGGERLANMLSSGLGHGVYTRLDAMLFHATLVTSRLYPSTALMAESTSDERRCAPL